ncbi:hypothetical protein JKF63_02913 [Porcisia hertigi]|uniref:Transmembrane protein n=1 Tax=Porcisia hertigi TaxID=2761500 RepID=A0A836HEM5_9TRYP|nr:hypothetical protein JKF63_02913 [Porcisia hertigi]
MPCMPLRDFVVLFDKQLHQLTLYYLANGFFTLPTAVVSIASVVVCGSLALATCSGNGGAAVSSISAPLLFTSFTSFVSLSLLTLMTLTLCYRVVGGRFVYAARATDFEVDWILDTLCRPMTEGLVNLLLAPEKRRQRGVFFMSLCTIGEAGKFLSFWSTCTLASMVWCGCNVRRAWRLPQIVD